MSTALGAFTAGEIPEPLEYTFQDSVGNPIVDITSPAWTVTFRFQNGNGTPVEAAASAAAGVATYVWVDGDITEGTWRGEFHAVGPANTFISERIVWRVRAAIPTP